MAVNGMTIIGWTGSNGCKWLVHNGWTGSDGRGGQDLAAGQAVMAWHQ